MAVAMSNVVLLLVAPVIVIFKAPPKKQVRRGLFAQVDRKIRQWDS